MKGEHISKNSLVQRYDSPTAQYGLKLPENKYEGGALDRGVGTLPSHTPSRFTSAKLVAGRIHGKPSAKVKATKSIRSSKEILVSYGKEYKVSEPGTTYSTKYLKTKL